MVLLGRADISVFFTTKLLWRSSYFPSACVKWKTYQDLAIKSQQSIPLWYQWACILFWNLSIFNHVALWYNKRSQKNYVILMFLQKRGENLFRETPPDFLLPLPKALPAFAVTCKCTADGANSEFKLALQSFSLRCRAALSLHLLLTQLFYRKIWKSFLWRGV